jgi:N-acetylneuraminic acid mutarotase
VAGTLPAFLHPGALSTSSSRGLTLEKRIDYQRAIEAVYWRHRNWPPGSADAKPCLDAVMSHAQLQSKVEEYLRNSQALEEYWHETVSSEQLQAEMNRMAAQTKQPDVLRELFQALGDDPLVIAECLARPTLTNRLLAGRYAYDKRFHGALRQQAASELTAHPHVDQMRETNGAYSELELIRTTDYKAKAERTTEHRIDLDSREWSESVGKLASTFGDSKAVEDASKAFERIPVQQVSALQEDDSGYYATAVIEKARERLKVATIRWSKEPIQSLQVKTPKAVPLAIAKSSSIYTLPAISGSASGCASDSWATSSINILTPREAHSAIWTGTEMIIWGGGVGYPSTPFNTGAKYNPSTDAWTSTTLVNAPSPRGGHSAVWTGTEMIVWGGGWMNDGGRYNPTTDTWKSLSTMNAPTPRSAHSAVWTGREMVVWGGDNSMGNLNDGGRYNPNTDSWKPISLINAPAARAQHSTVWTGHQMIVWGGYIYNYVNQFLNTGGVYDPSTDTWSATTTTNAPNARESHTAVWTGSRMIVWGGDNAADPCECGPYATGAQYDPATNTWTPTTLANAPPGRHDHTAVWTGKEMVVWGGATATGFVNTGARYNPNTDSWTGNTTTANAPPERWRHSAVWTGSEMIVWGGIGNGTASGYVNTLGRYNPKSDTWVSTHAPTARMDHTAVWTGSEMIVWGGQDGYFILNSGGKYSPATDSWTPTSSVNAPEKRWAHTAVWTGKDMIVWGGSNDTHNLNAGSRYDPLADAWTNISPTNAPSGRSFHTAVWTGKEMIIWGGNDDSGTTLNTGGRYSPTTDTWNATTSINAPTTRFRHTGVWTGEAMIIWGGTPSVDYSTALNTGAMYHPGSDSWVSTTLTNAPAARLLHSAVWTGNEMIVWGGEINDNNTAGDNSNLLNNGAKFNPITNSWTPTSVINAPTPRTVFSAVWSGTEMIVWGGFNNTEFWSLTGGRYDPAADNWISTSTDGNAPVGRYRHSAVWADRQMIVWGGVAWAFGMINNGGLYCGDYGATPTPTATPNPTPTPSHTRVITVNGNLNFGQVTIGQSSILSTNISNSGNSVLTVNGISYPPGFAGDWLSGVIQPGQSQIVNVIFAPTAVTTYSGAVMVNSDKTDGNNVITASGTGVQPVATEPTISPPSGNFQSSVTVTITDSMPGAQIHYTTNGAIPDSSSPIYNPTPVTRRPGHNRHNRGSGLTLGAGIWKVKAIAEAPGYSNSPIAEQDYIVLPKSGKGRHHPH